LGIVLRQAALSSLYSYAGHVIGFVNVAILMNRWFTPEEFGLRVILLDIAVVFAQVAHLGTYRSLVKFFPIFNREGKYDSGLLSIGLLVSLAGFLIFSSFLFIFQDQILAQYQGKSPLFESYFLLIFPLSFFLLFNNLFESYLQSRADTALAAFLKNVLNRLIITCLVLAYFLKWIDFHWFINLFVYTNIINIAILITYLRSKGEFSLKRKKGFFRKKLRKVYFNYSAFSIVSNISSGLINRIDALMIGFYLGLTSAAVYGNALYISILIYLPAKAIGQISLPLLSKSWKEKKIDEMEVLYKKSSLNQLLVGGFFFVLVWSSIDNLFAIQRAVYTQGKYVVLILGLAKVLNMTFGVNGHIVKVSKYYRFDTVLSAGLAIFTVITNLILIPIYGVEGAASATAISILIFNLIRFGFVYRKMGIQPFTSKSVVALFVLGFVFFLGVLLPKLENVYLDTFYRSAVLMIFMTLLVYFLKISEDINQLVEKVKAKIEF